MLNINVYIKLSHIIIMFTILVIKKYAVFHKCSNINEHDINLNFKLMTLLQEI